MEFVDGPPLKTLLDKHERFALADTVRVMEDLLAGLQFSHERGVVHRDIKPANVMLTSGGPGEDRRFRHRADREQLDDPGRHAAGHAGLHVARAVHGPGGRRAHRHLFVGRAALSVADRRAAVRGQHVGDHAQGAEHRAAGAVAAFGDRAAVVRRRGAPGDGEAAGGPVRVGQCLCRGDAGRAGEPGGAGRRARTKRPWLRRRAAARRRRGHGRATIPAATPASRRAASSRPSPLAVAAARRSSAAAPGGSSRSRPVRALPVVATGDRRADCRAADPGRHGPPPNAAGQCASGANRIRPSAPPARLRSHRQPADTGGRSTTAAVPS